MTTNVGGTTTRRTSMHYPFAAIVGQDDLKTCLILCAIDPSIGGVLIRGDKGTAKSTAARGLARLLPPIEVGYDPNSGACDPYNRDELSIEDVGGVNEDMHVPTFTKVRQIPTPFVDLPLGATEDRVLGSIDFSATLKQGGKRVFSPGLLAAANRGVLYVDEVNLLPAHLVDVLLDAAAMGVNTVQREGITMSHPSRFMLIGTMNPEEGDLRPQLLDRFGLMVDVKAPDDYKMRSEVVRQRIAFERDPEMFREQWHEAEMELEKKIQAATDLLSEVVLSDDLLLLISRICTEFQVGSLRADITLFKSASALAAWEGRTHVKAEDVRRAAGWVLAHRRRRQPFDSPMDGPTTNELLDNLIVDPPENQKSPENHSNDPEPTEHQANKDNNDSQAPPKNNDDNNNDSNHEDGDNNMHTFTASKPDQIKKIKLVKQQKGHPGTGRRNHINNTQRGYYVRSAPTDKPADLALDATLRAASANGVDSKTGHPIIYPENWRRKARNSTTDTIILFVVDASGSMSARQRMESVKGSVLALLTDAYQQRDRVGVIAFRGLKAEVLLEPTKSIELAEKQLQRLPTGGRTPLAHAFSLTYDFVQRLKRLEPEQAILLIVMSDGKANVPLPDSPPESDSWTQTESCAQKLSTLDIPSLLLDTDVGNKYVRVGRGKELAQSLNADYLQLDELSADGLVHVIRQAVQ